MPSDDYLPLAFSFLHPYHLRMPKKLVPGAAYRKRYSLSFNPRVMEPFRELCEKSDMSLSRVFEGFADVFITSMRPGEGLREEYSRMMTLYFNYRRDHYDVPDVVSEVDNS